MAGQLIMLAVARFALRLELTYSVLLGLAALTAIPNIILSRALARGADDARRTALVLTRQFGTSVKAALDACALAFPYFRAGDNGEREWS